jgi:ankyrin repeat protein
MYEAAGRILRAFFTSVDDGLLLANMESDLLNARTGLGETPLHYLAVENHIEAIKALVEKKSADVNTLNDFGGSPISDAARLGYVELVSICCPLARSCKSRNRRNWYYMLQSAPAVPKW